MNNLHQAVLNEDLGVLRCLIKEDKYYPPLNPRTKTYIDQTDEKGHTPLSLAIMEEKYLAAKYILFSEANVKLGGY
jgi:ankyrin repeat protein